MFCSLFKTSYYQGVVSFIELENDRHNKSLNLDFGKSGLFSKPGSSVIILLKSRILQFQTCQSPLVLALAAP